MEVGIKSCGGHPFHKVTYFHQRHISAGQFRNNSTSKHLLYSIITNPVPQSQSFDYQHEVCSTLPLVLGHPGWKTPHDFRHEVWTSRQCWRKSEPVCRFVLTDFTEMMDTDSVVQLQTVRRVPFVPVFWASKHLTGFYEQIFFFFARGI